MDRRQLLFPRFTSISIAISAATHVGALAVVTLWSISLPDQVTFHGKQTSSPLTLQASWLEPPTPTPIEVELTPMKMASVEPVATASPTSQLALATRERAQQVVGSKPERVEPAVDEAVPEIRSTRRNDQRDSAEAEPAAAKIVKRRRTARPVVVRVKPPQRIGVDERTPPNFSVTRAPKYPPQAHALGHEGEVVLRLYVSAKGVVERVEVAESTGYAELDQAAVTAVSSWRGRPAFQGGRAVATTEKLRIRFRIPRQ